MAFLPILVEVLIFQDPTGIPGQDLDHALPLHGMYIGIADHLSECLGGARARGVTLWSILED